MKNLARDFWHQEWWWYVALIIVVTASAQNIILGDWLNQLLLVLGFILGYLCKVYGRGRKYKL